MQIADTQSQIIASSSSVDESSELLHTDQETFAAFETSSNCAVTSTLMQGTSRDGFQEAGPSTDNFSSGYLSQVGANLNVVYRMQNVVLHITSCNWNCWIYFGPSYCTLN